MRADFQILVIPFIIKDKIPYYAVFRTKSDYWQFIAGGGEEDESILAAAKRETEEESGITSDDLIRLDTVCSIPKFHFKAHAERKDIYVIPEYAFAVKVNDEQLTLSSEHTEYRWELFSSAIKLLKFDSNKTAVWEVEERVKEGVIY